MTDPFECDSCREEFFNPHQVITIPMDEFGKKVSGCFCSLECALKDNRYMNRSNRTVFGWEDREKWLLQKEKGKKVFDPTVSKRT